MKRLIVLFACCTALTLFSAPANAGLYQLDVTLVNMTPDPVSDDARNCSRSFERLLRRAEFGEVTIRRMGETAFRRALDNPTSEFSLWGPAVQDALENDAVGQSDYAGVIAFECRPEDNTFIGLAVNGQGHAVIRHRGPITRRALQFMVRRLVRDAAVF